MKVRLLVRSLAAAVVGLSLVSGFAAEGVSFAHRPLLAGKASLASDGDFSACTVSPKTGGDAVHFIRHRY